MTDEDYVAELRSHGMLSTNKAADRIEQLTAERDRLRAIGTEMAESIEGNYYLPGVATRWVAALKGETP